MENPFTADSFFGGRLLVKQPQKGYRFSIDAVLLAWYSRPTPGDTVLDLGTGCGIIPMILAFRHGGIHIHGLEIQANLGKLAQENVKQNGLQQRITIHTMDMRALPPKTISAPVDLIVSNPPYRRMNSGRLNPDSQRAVARHEIEINLAQLIGTVKRFLRTAGRFMAIYPAERMADMLVQLRTDGIEPKQIRMIHSRSGAEAKRFLVEAVKGARPGIKVAPSLLIYQKDGTYTDEVERMFAP
jgi:tRNA1Val (adenine37-N6)-methyltransferase